MNEKETIFPFRWGENARIITILVVILLVGLSTFTLVNSNFNSVGIIIWSIVFLLVFYFVLKTPLRLRINGPQITIEQIGHKTTILMNDIIAIHSVPTEILKKADRDFGSGGFCGFIGWFSTLEIGRFYIYATELRNFVCIKTQSKKYVVNCSDFEILLNYWENRVN